MMLIFGLLIALAHGADSDDGVLLMQMRAKMMAETETTSDWQVGDGSGGSETRIGDASSRDECEGMCTDRAATDATINGCTYSNSGGTGCFVEIGMTGHNGNSNWQTQCLPGKYCGEDFPAPAAEVSTEADTWQVGDGSGGSETRIGDASSKDECEGMCTDRAATDSTINGCTYSNSGGTGCFVEIGMTGHNGNSNWQTTCLPSKYCGETFSPAPAPEVPTAASTSVWQVGDGSGGSEQRIGDASTLDECEGMCLDRAATDATVNGCTYSNSGGTGCFVEIGMTGHNGNSNWQTTCLPSKYCGESFPAPAPDPAPAPAPVPATTTITTPKPGKCTSKCAKKAKRAKTEKQLQKKWKNLCKKKGCIGCDECEAINSLLEDEADDDDDDDELDEE